MTNPIGAITIVKGVVDVAKEMFSKPQPKPQPQSKTA
jgi:hypothetical protein